MYNRDSYDHESYERMPRRRPRDGKRNPREKERDRTRKLARQAKYEMQGRTR